MTYDLIKITKEEYAMEILKGNLYMNPLSFFRKCENNYMDDITEGVCGDIPKNQMRQLGYYFTDDIIDNIVTDNVLMLSDSFATCNLFCMYCLFHDEDNRKISKFDERLLQFSDTAVWIRNVTEFKKRVENAIYLKCKQGISEYGSYGKVRYYDINEQTNRMDSKSCFNKILDYQWQQEWRICLWSHNLREEAITLSIGDISDIACIIPAKQISNTLANFYKNYTTFVQKPDEKENVQLYTTISNGDVISRLMAKYSDIPICKIERSDESEALNHLSRYYELHVNLDKAEEILKEIVETERSWANYRLLINFYLRTKKFNEVNKVYWDIIENHLDLIENKVDFFYAIHQFYMHSKKPYDAGMIYIGWSHKIFHEEQALAIEHDIYFGLNMSDRAIETAKKITEKYGDREILNFYNAVSYMCLLDFEKAREYLNKFKENYHPSLIQNKYANKIEDKLTILEGKRKIIIDEKAQNGWEKINLNQESMNKIKQQISSICIIEDMTLYAIYKAGCEEYLDGCKKIIISAKAVYEIVDHYCVTGDRYLLEIIHFLKKDDRIIICSPVLRDLMRESLNSEDDMIMLMTKVLAMEVAEKLKQQDS